jgi:hypothetical protein
MLADVKYEILQNMSTAHMVLDLSNAVTSWLESRMMNAAVSLHCRAMRRSDVQLLKKYTLSPKPRTTEKYGELITLK